MSGPTLPVGSFAAYTRAMIAAGATLDLSEPGTARLVGAPITFDEWRRDR